MATLNLGRVRMAFKGEYSALNGTTLEFFDAVTYGGSLYVVTATTVVVDDSDTGNRPPTTNGQASFLRITTGVQFVGQWSDGGPNSTSDLIYYENQIVRYGPNTFIALQEVPTGRPSPIIDYNNNAGYWQILAKGFGNYIPNFNSDKQLDPGDVVTFAGSIWLATDAVNIGEDPNSDPNKFDRLDTRLDPRGEWNSNTSYDLNQSAVFHGSSYVVIADSTSNPPIDSNGDINEDWVLLVQGFDWVGQWNYNTAYYKGEILVYNGGSYVVLEKTSAGQHPGNAPTKFEELLPGDAIRESDFNTDGFLVRQNSLLTIDTNSYLTENDTITLDGHISGSGKVSITTSLTVDAVVNQSLASSVQTNANGTTILGAIDTGGGNYELRKLNPDHLRADLPADFDDSQGIERVSLTTGPTVTLGINDKIIANLPTVTETNLIANIANADALMVRDFSTQELYKITWGQLIIKINDSITGNQVDGVTQFRSLLDTPGSYTGQAGNFVKVNGAETGLEFVEDDVFLQILVYG